jgi:signal transduction histidine kinase
MGWTPSTRPRGNIARISDFARPRMEPGAPSSRLAATVLVQSVLLAAFATIFIAGNQITGGKIAEVLAIVALVSAAIGAYLVVRSDRETADSNETSRPCRHVHLAHPISREHPVSDAEQLAQLKARVSHELRTPLNAVIGFSELMHREALGPVGNDRYREYAAHIRRSAEYFQWATERTLAVTEMLASPRRHGRTIVPLERVASAAFARALTERSTEAPIVRTAAIDEQIEIEGCAVALDHSLHYLMSAALAVADAGIGGGRIEIVAECHECGQVSLSFRVPLKPEAAGSFDAEQAPGTELSLLLARLGLELLGAHLDAGPTGPDCWSATAWLTQARQREFALA